VANPERKRAQDALDETTRLANAAAKDAPVLKQLAVQAGPCNAQTPICDFIPSGLTGLPDAHQTAARVVAQRAQETLQKTPETVTDGAFEYTSRVMRRRGEAVAQMRMFLPGKENAPVVLIPVRVNFEAVEADVPNDAERKLTARLAHAPTDQEVEKALAEALVPRIDQLIGDWIEQRRGLGDSVPVSPGTRGRMVGVARHAASDRPVKLIGDFLETRENVLKQFSNTFPVKLPSDSSNRCFTFAATPVEGRGDVNLVFGYMVGPRFVKLGQDVRLASEAAFELCHPRAGDYVLGITWSADVAAKGLVVSMFDSTPGTVTDADARAAAEGAPAAMGK
jgi:hypothetical protein